MALIKDVQNEMSFCAVPVSRLLATQGLVITWFCLNNITDVINIDGMLFDIVFLTYDIVYNVEHKA